MFYKIGEQILGPESGNDDIKFKKSMLESRRSDKNPNKSTMLNKSFHGSVAEPKKKCCN